MQINRACCVVAVIAALIAVLLPNPTAKLCIAPGSHVAVEEIGADCCAHSVPHEPIKPATDDSWNATGECGCCTDIVIVLFGQATIQTPQFATVIPADENPMFYPPADSSESALRQEPAGDKAIKTVPAPPPLRC